MLKTKILCLSLLKKTNWKYIRDMNVSSVPFTSTLMGSASRYKDQQYCFDWEPLKHRTQTNLIQVVSY